jgi:hypothetical protein
MMGGQWEDWLGSGGTKHEEGGEQIGPDKARGLVGMIKGESIPPPYKERLIKERFLT